MKVLMIGRSGLFDAPGGDRIQIENTATELKKLGIKVDIKTGLNLAFENYDIIHVFQLDWNPDSFFHAIAAKKHNKPLVFSPIHHSVKEVKRFDDDFVFDFRRIAKFLFRDQFNRDVFKDVYRTIFNPRLLKATMTSILVGLKRMHKTTVEKADVVLVQTKREAQDLKNTFDVKINWKIVNNGVSDKFLNPPVFKNELGFENYILCVGRVEARKNQLSIIKAVEKLREEDKKDYKLVFVGKKSGIKHFEYAWWFGRALNKHTWIKHVEEVPYEKMPSFYKFAKVCVSASWFETFGLTSLEALVLNTNAVASGERVKECLGNYISYCDPGDINSIKNAIKKEYDAPRPNVSEKLKKEYTWKHAAQATLAIYKGLLTDSIKWKRTD